MFEDKMDSVYPISLEEIHAKVSKKKRRRKSFRQLDWIQPSRSEPIQEIVNEFGETLVRIDGDIPKHLKVKSGERFLFISYDQSILTHGIHKYPAKFFPELPRWLIQRYSKEGDTILDPFSGSGTTNLESLLLKRHSVGIDIDPFSRYIAQVKVTPLEERELLASKEALLASILVYQPCKVSKSDIPSFPYRDVWFNQEIILELAYIKKSIDLLETHQTIKDFFRVCFSSIIRSVSNADNHCTRTVIRKKLNKQILPSDALKKFVEAVLSKTPKMIEFSQKHPKAIKTIFPDRMDARNIQYDTGSFDLALTSPPYANAVDYPRTHQLEIYWLGFFEGSLSALKKQCVGTETVSSSDYNTLHQIGVEEADATLLKIFQQDTRRAYIAFKYLEDMEKNLREVYRVLKDGGRYIVVVGNNKIRGELFESWKYIIKLAENLGFSLEIYFGSEIIKHFIKVPRNERINTDWVLVLKKIEIKKAGIDPNS